MIQSTQDPPFHGRLEAAFRRYADAAPVDVDARMMAIAARSAAGSVGRRRPMVGPRARLVLLAAALVAGLAAAAASIGSRPPIVVDAPDDGPLVTRHQYAGVFEPLGSAFGGSLAAETLVTLADGRVLGLDDSWPEHRPQAIWDPFTNRFTRIGTTVGKRQNPVGVLLADDRVLIIGGDITEPVNGSGTATYSTAELFDPATGSFRTTGPMVGKGWAPSAIRLRDGRVLVLDGISVDDAQSSDPLLRTAEVYDPVTDTWTATADLVAKAGGANMALLPDGRVLLVGGTWPETNQAEIFDPPTATFSQTDDLPADGVHPSTRTDLWPQVAATAVALPDGRILVPGRHCDEISQHDEAPTPAAIFDPATERFSPTAPMPHCVEQAIALPDGRIFLRSFWVATTWSGIYDPADGTITETAPPPGGRYMNAVGLPDGRLLVTADGAASIFR